MQELYFTPRRRELLTVLLTGLLGTALMMLLAWLAATYLVGPVFCKTNQTGLCSSPLNVSYNAFLIIGALVAVGIMARERIFRPALVALPPVVLLWSLPAMYPYLSGQNLFVFMAAVSVIAAISYVTFYWLLRIKNFVIMFVLLLIVTLGVRWFVAN